MSENLELTTRRKENNIIIDSGESTKIQQITDERLMALTPDRQNAVREFSEKINLSDMDIITNYGNIPLQKSADVTGKFLEKVAGEEDDKEIVEMISELSETTNKGQQEIEILAKKPNFIQKLIYLFKGTSREDEMKLVIKSTYDLITKLKANMEASLDTLMERSKDAEVITKSNIETAQSLEEYLVAGYLALERAKEESSNISASANVQDQMLAKSLNSGIRAFEYKLRTLEEAKTCSLIAATQAITDVENMNTLHLMISSKSQSVLTLFSQMGSNAILNNTTKRIHESQGTLDMMSKAMLEKISEDTAASTVAIAKSFTEGFDPDTAIKCMETLHNGFIEAAKFYEEFSSSRETELVKVRESEKKILPVLNEAIAGSTAKIDVDIPKDRLSI